MRICEIFKRAHGQWVEHQLQNGLAVRDDRWSEAIAVGSLAFIETVKSELGVKTMHRAVVQTHGTYALRQQSEAYGHEFAGESDTLRLENTISWDENAEAAET